MLYPSIDLLKEKVSSKYLLVTIAAKRARQIQEEGDLKLSEYKSLKPVGKALEEVAAGELQIENPMENHVSSNQ